MAFSFAWRPAEAGRSSARAAPRVGTVWPFEHPLGHLFGHHLIAVFPENRSAGFPRHHRLTKTDDFSSVFGFGRAIRSTHFLLHYGPCGSGQSKGARLGLGMAKRYLRRSVDRNLVKRLVREAFRTQRSGLPSRDLIVRLVVKPGLPIDRRALAGEIQKLLEKCASLEPG